MKIIVQLLKEFWLPLLLGIAWTLYSFLDKPIGDWSTRNLINMFGPTFFFMSWLVAQWYRVKKQQKVEDGLAHIQTSIQAINSPRRKLETKQMLRFAIKSLVALIEPHEGHVRPEARVITREEFLVIQDKINRTGRLTMNRAEMFRIFAADEIGIFEAMAPLAASIDERHLLAWRCLASHLKAIMHERDDVLMFTTLRDYLAVAVDFDDLEIQTG